MLIVNDIQKCEIIKTNQKKFQAEENVINLIFQKVTELEKQKISVVEDLFYKNLDMKKLKDDFLNIKNKQNHLTTK